MEAQKLWDYDLDLIEGHVTSSVTLSLNSQYNRY